MPHVQGRSDGIGCPMQHFSGATCVAALLLNIIHYVFDPTQNEETQN